MSVAAATAVLLAFPAAGLAQGPGVHVDPGSPAGKEYGIPLEQARRGAGGEGTGAFGAGIAPTTRGGPPGGSGSSAQREARNRLARKRRARAAVAGGGPAVAARSVSDSGALSPVLVTGLIALGVIGGGAALGLGLRRFQPR